MFPPCFGMPGSQVLGDSVDDKELLAEMEFPNFLESHLDFLRIDWSVTLDDVEGEDKVAAA